MSEKVILPNAPIPWLKMVLETARILVSQHFPWRQDPMEPELLANLLLVALRGGTHVDMANLLTNSQEYKDYHAVTPPIPDPDPIPTTLGRLRKSNRLLYDQGGVFRMRYVGGFALAQLFASGKSDEAKRYLDWVARPFRDIPGFNGVRVMLGELGWAGQTRDSALRGLPPLLRETQARGIRLEATCLTGTKAWTTDQIKAHVREIGQVCRVFPHVHIEIGNELQHSSQHDKLSDLEFLKELARSVPAELLVALGAGPKDEPTVNPDQSKSFWPNGGTDDEIINVHLGRSWRNASHPWEMVRHIRELEDVSNVTGDYVVSNEPIGAAEVAERGRRESRGEVFYALGYLSRGFELGAVHHAEHCLMATIPPAGSQQEWAARWFLTGHADHGTADVLDYQNTGWSRDTAPIKDAAFGGTFTRAYSFIRPSGRTGQTALIGWRGQRIEFQNGWHQTDVVRDLPEFRVIRVER
jgi:hypothetical protein